jgi:hypothetical protein
METDIKSVYKQFYFGDYSWNKFLYNFNWQLRLGMKNNKILLDFDYIFAELQPLLYISHVEILYFFPYLVAAAHS